MPPKSRDHNPSGLGRAIINRKIKDAKQVQESGLFSVEPDSSKHLMSVTQERDLDEFLHTAQLAGTDFTAEKRNIKVLPQATAALQNSISLDVEEKKLRLSQLENKQRLRVPRRPPWTRSVSPAELDRKEKAAFLDWRRGLAELQDRDEFLLTPFERNIEVWRQLWRVLERSHLVVQIVDARNPLRFRCEDLETYVAEIEGTEGEKGTGKGNRRSMLLINKADLLTPEQRITWADYFDAQGAQYVFYSAANIAAIQDVRRIEELRQSDAVANDDDQGVQVTPRHGSDLFVKDDPYDDESDKEYYSANERNDSDPDPRGKILSAAELELMLVKNAPDPSEFLDSSGNPSSKVTIGLVGYPNVGKSSTINSLLGEKKVSVSSTPGKTKHFQTIDLSDSLMLCDCPGLVFPQFASTKADLVCDGVLPIDQLREYTGPVTLITNRLPKEILEATYGLTIRTFGIADGGDGTVTSESLLVAYAIARGFMRSGQGNPDEARAARYILKDYVDGKLLYCHPPPGVPETEFNRPTHKNAALRLIGKKHAPITRVGKNSDTFVRIPSLHPTTTGLKETRSDAIDDSFFQDSTSLLSRPLVQQGGNDFSRSMLYPHQNTVAADGTPIDPRQARLFSLLENIDKDKKHKKVKRVKQRSGRGYGV